MVYHLTDELYGKFNHLLEYAQRIVVKPWNSLNQETVNFTS